MKYLAFVIVGALSLTACSGPSSEGGESADPGTTEVAEEAEEKVHGTGGGGGTGGGKGDGAGSRDGSGPGAPAAAPATEPATGSGGLEALRAHTTELAARAEHDAVKVVVQHVLVSFAGTRTQATRSKEEAEKLAAELYAQLLAGADLDAMMKEHSDDPGGGVYGMTTDANQFQPAATPMVRMRSGPNGMVPAFGDVGWKLEVDEIGVAPYSSGSPYGWHIIKRLE